MRSDHTPCSQTKSITLTVLSVAFLQSVIELSRTQDEEVGDGTTSVIILGNHPFSHNAARIEAVIAMRSSNGLCSISFFGLGIWMCLRKSHT